MSPRARSIVVVLPLLLVLGACNGGDESRDVSDVDAAQVLEAAAVRLEEAESFHVKIEHENGSTQIISGLAMTEAEGDYAGTDRVQLDILARVLGTNISSGIVILPDGEYFKNPINGRWVEQDLDIAQIFDPSSGVTALMRDATDPRAVSAERINGVEAYLIEAQVDSGDLVRFVANAQPGMTVDARVWVGIDDSRVYRAEIIGPVAPDDADDIVRRIELSAYDEPVDI
ncbi:MAG: LppX_LprAFG lipoprotein, partial [Dehalococcoidia bacterium]